VLHAIGKRFADGVQAVAEVAHLDDHLADVVVGAEAAHLDVLVERALDVGPAFGFGRREIAHQFLELEQVGFGIPGERLGVVCRARLPSL
jgi:hypothetical protein